MSEGSVIFKGSLNGLTIIMKEEEDYDSILKQIEDKIASSGRFFKGAILSVKYRGKKLTEEQERKLFELLRDKTGRK